jgi:hypothetical protein
MNISYETTPQDVLRALGFPDDLMTPGEWVSVRGVQLTKGVRADPDGGRTGGGPESEEWREAA